MHQTKKGNRWHLGMKAYIGVDAGSALVHTVIGTAANFTDMTQATGLLQPGGGRLHTRRCTSRRRSEWPQKANINPKKPPKYDFNAVMRKLSTQLTLRREFCKPCLTIGKKPFGSMSWKVYCLAKKMPGLSGHIFS